MKKTKALSLILAAAMTASLMTGCSSSNTASTAESSTEETTAEETTTAADSESAAEETTAADMSFDFSAGLTDAGMFDGVTALDFAVLPTYNGIEIAPEDYQVDDETLQTQIDSMMANYASPEQIKDREVADGDTVNIDYVGSVDGVEFDGGSTNGAGTSVTIGVTSYIDDFLEQLIGHQPGETFNVEDTFPDEYPQNTDLQGKDAVFVTTINYIEGDSVTPELTDAFVAENFQESTGASTVEELRTYVHDNLQKSNVYNAVIAFLKENTEITEIPAAVSDFQANTLANQYKAAATQYGLDLETYLSYVAGASTIEEAVNANQESLDESAKLSLIFQAIAEDAKLTVSDDDIAAYFENLGFSDSSAMIDYYGKGFVTMSVLDQKVQDLLLDSAVLK